MRITWLGHAAFLIEGANRRGAATRIVLDPYNYPGCGGYLPVDVEADVVSVSHDNPRYHSDTSAIRGRFELFRAIEHVGERTELRGVEFRAHEVFEDDEGSGPNAMVRFELDGLTLSHLGDLGHALDDAGLDFLRGTDVLLALAGGSPTIALADLRVVADRVRPAVIVPMHFKTPKVDLDLLPLDAFLEQFAELPREHPGTATWKLTRETLPARPTVLVLEHAR